jgi:hypothetical protein
MINLLFFIVSFSLFCAEHNCNNNAPQQSNQSNLAMLGYCREVAKNPTFINDNLAAITSAWKDNFNDYEFEKEFPQTALQKDTRLQQAHALLKDRYKDKSIWLQKIVDNGQASIWSVHFDSYHKNYIINHINGSKKKLPQLEDSSFHSQIITEDDHYIYGIIIKKHKQMALSKIKKSNYAIQEELALPHPFICSLMCANGTLYSADDESVYELSSTLTVLKKYFIAKQIFPDFCLSLPMNSVLVNSMSIGSVVIDPQKNSSFTVFDKNNFNKVALSDSQKYLATFGSNTLYLYQIHYDGQIVFELIKEHQIPDIINFTFVPEQEGLLYILFEPKLFNKQLAVFDALRRDSLLHIPINCNYKAQFYNWNQKIYMNGDDNTLLHISLEAFGYSFIKQTCTNNPYLSDSIQHEKLPILPEKREEGRLSIWTF